MPLLRTPGRLQAAALVVTAVAVLPALAAPKLATASCWVKRVPPRGR